MAYLAVTQPEYAVGSAGVLPPLALLVALVLVRQPLGGERDRPRVTPTRLGSRTASLAEADQ